MTTPRAPSSSHRTTTSAPGESPAHSGSRPPTTKARELARAFVSTTLVAGALAARGSLAAVGTLTMLTTLTTLTVCTEREAAADVRQPGTRNLKYAFSIDNPTAFPGFAILAFPWSLSNGVPTQEVFVVKTPNPVLVGRWGQPEFYAIRTASFDEERTKGFDASTLEKFFKDNPQVIDSGVKVEPVRSVPEADPITGVEDVFTIVECTDKKLVIKPKLVRYTYKEGGTNEVAYLSSGARPKAPPTAAAPPAPSASAPVSSGAAPPPAAPPKGGCACEVGREDGGESTPRAFVLAGLMIAAGGVAWTARRRPR